MIRIDKFARLICAVSVFWGTTVFATDGVLEINQACAINGGCFPGDGPGFPVQASPAISGSTSFILTSDLLIEDVDKRGVQMGNNDTNATLDLNGFTIRGPVFCEGSGAAVDCDLNGIGEGIRGFGRVTVKNGTVIGFGNRGIYIDSGRIMRVTAIGNFGDGIRIGREGGAINNLPVGSLVSECIANGNNGQGIVQIHGIVKNSYASGNRTNGFTIENGGSLQGSTAVENGGDGINVGTGDSSAVTTLEMISNNTSINNGGVGIIGGKGVHIRNNLVSENNGNGIQVSVGGLILGNTVYGNGGHGIHVGSSNLVIDNAMRANTGFGLYFVGSQSNYHGNLMSINTGGNVGGTGTGLNTGQNTCGNSTTCP